MRNLSEKSAPLLAVRNLDAFYGDIQALFGVSMQIEAGEAAGLRMTFPQNLDFVLGSTEPPMQRCISQYLAPADVFYDIGANVGANRESRLAEGVNAKFGVGRVIFRQQDFQQAGLHTTAGSSSIRRISV